MKTVNFAAYRYKDAQKSAIERIVKTMGNAVVLQCVEENYCHENQL